MEPWLPGQVCTSQVPTGGIFHQGIAKLFQPHSYQTFIKLVMVVMVLIHQANIVYCKQENTKLILV